MVGLCNIRPHLHKENTVSIQLQFQRAMKIRHVGYLDILGTSEKSGKSGDSTIVTFLLSFTDDDPLTRYFAPHGFRPDSLLWQIFVGDGIQVANSLAGNNGHFLVFTREVAGNLRDADRFLHATGNKLLRELQQLEENELSLDEWEAQVAWAENAAIHGRTDPMPDFTLPRHE